MAPGATGKSWVRAVSGEPAVAAAVVLALAPAGLYRADRHGKWVTSYNVWLSSNSQRPLASIVKPVVTMRPPVTRYLPAGKGNLGASIIMPEFLVVVDV
jgi:hypothetical protein